MLTKEKRYKVVPGPEGILPPSAAYMGIILPEEGQGLLEGDLVNEEKAMEAGATAMLTRKNPTLFPGPLILWGWNAHANEKARIVLEIAREIPGVKIIPMPDYRPIYPKIDPEAVINPCHPNLTILHNKIEVCAFIGVHCHYANVTLKMIRAGTNCYTIALCAAAGHEDAMMSIPTCEADKLVKFRDTLIRVKKNGVKPLYEGKGIIPSSAYQRARLTGEDFKPVVADETPGFGHDLEKGLDENEE